MPKRLESRRRDTGATSKVRFWPDCVASVAPFVGDANGAHVRGKHHGPQARRRREDRAAQARSRQWLIYVGGSPADPSRRGRKEGRACQGPWDDGPGIVQAIRRCRAGAASARPDARSVAISRRRPCSSLTRTWCPNRAATHRDPRQCPEWMSSRRNGSSSRRLRRRLFAPAPPFFRKVHAAGVSQTLPTERLASCSLAGFFRSTATRYGPMPTFSPPDAPPGARHRSRTVRSRPSCVPKAWPWRRATCGA